MKNFVKTSGKGWICKQTRLWYNKFIALRRPAEQAGTRRRGIPVLGLSRYSGGRGRGGRKKNDRMEREIEMEIRQEQPRDYDEVYRVVQEAFASAEHRDGNEQDLAAALRKSQAFVPPLSLVAEEGGRVVGHILFTEIRIGDKTDLALAPLSVLPAYQRQGIGQALMARGHAEAARLGYGFSVVLGSPAYYSRAGYVPAARYGIRSPFDVPDEYFMALDLQGNSPDREGTVEYAAEFFSV